MHSDANSGKSFPRQTMRKRKRGTEYGSYVDEDTGEITTVQTSKQAKRAHQKSGKWYKEPTEAELRAWDREEKRQAIADRAAKREENKKINAAKRAEKEHKDGLLKRQMFEMGKITFTQTLAKKDEDQKNLHSWFGVRPGISKLKTTLAINGHSESNKDQEDRQDKEDKADQTGATATVPDHGLAADDGACLNKVKKLSQGDIDRFEQEIDDGIDIEHIFQPVTTSPQETSIAKSEPLTRPETMNRVMDLIMDQDLIPDFDILEDNLAGDVVPDQVTNLSSTNPFKVPALPKHAQSPTRLPLSPMSPSDVNIRNSQTSTQVSSFKSRLENAKINTTPSTQVVRDILWGLSTQDLNDDLEVSDKENDAPGSDDTCTVDVFSKPARQSSPLSNVSMPPKEVTLFAEPHKSFNSNFDPTGYDDIFFELDTAEKAGRTHNLDNNVDVDDFDDGLDDATLLALPPATQLAAAARNSTALGFANEPNPAMSKAPRQPLTKVDSFAVAFEGLDDDDLLAGLNEYDDISRGSDPTTTATTVPVCTSQQFTATALSPRLKKKGRVLPWERPSRQFEADGTGIIMDDGVEAGGLHESQEDIDETTVMATQDTQVLSSFGY